MSRFARKVDGNHGDIVEALRNAGYSVASLATVGNGCPDIIVGKDGFTFLMEIKMPGEKLNKAQREWAKRWMGLVVRVDSVERALFVANDIMHNSGRKSVLC